MHGGREPRNDVPRSFQFAMLFFIMATGTVPSILQASLFGLSGGGETEFSVYLVTGLLYDLLRIAPLIVLARHPAGLLHPINVAIVLWPLLVGLPSLIDNFGGYAGIFAGRPVSAPYYTALAWKNSPDIWSGVAVYNLVKILSLLSVYAGFAFVRSRSGRKITAFAGVDTLQLRRILVAIILVNFLAAAIFIETRGGLIDHIAELSYGRFRALAGLGPLLVLFDSGFICVLLWICHRPQDASHPLFLLLLPLVAAQQFLVAGSRAAALLVFVLAGLAWALRSNRMPWRLAVVMLPIAFLSFGALNIVRSSGLTNSTAVQAAQSASFDDVMERSQEEFALRESLSGTVPVVTDATRTTGLMWGYTYTGAVFAMVPRSIWEGKPRGPGSIYAQRFLGQDREGTAVPIGPVAEAFWNFHIPGVILIFGLYGFVLKRAYEIYAVNRRNGLVTMVFVLFATQFGVSTDELVVFQQSILTLGLVLGIILLFLPRARKVKGRSRLKPPSIQVFQ